MTATPNFPIVKSILKNDQNIYRSASLQIITAPPFATTADINLFVVEYLASEVSINVGGTSACSGCTFTGTKVSKAYPAGTSVITL